MNIRIFPYGVRPGDPEWVTHSDPFVERVRVMVARHNLGLRDDSDDAAHVAWYENR